MQQLGVERDPPRLDEAAGFLELRDANHTLDTRFGALFSTDIIEKIRSTMDD